MAGAVPDDAARLYEAGLALWREGDLRGAFEAIESAVELFPDFGDACKALARMSVEANEIRAFQNWCHEAARIDPLDPDPYVMLGDLLARQRRRDEALEAYGRALSLRPLGSGERSRVDAAMAELESMPVSKAWRRTL